MSQPSRESNRASLATKELARQFRSLGWLVDEEPRVGLVHADLIARKGSVQYVIELKTIGEGRADRVIALLSQAILQASAYGRVLSMRPLAVVRVDIASPSLLARIEKFRQDYAPDVSVGLMSDAGLSRFIGPYLDGLDQVSTDGRTDSPPRPRHQTDLFSDLNQWMLKVLLAPDVPQHLLTAPHREYRTGAELAEVSGVSLMSASRFLRRLKEEGFLDDAGTTLRIVRRHELFRRWRSSAMRSSPELPVSFILPSTGIQQLQKVTSTLGGCIGLYAAADVLGLGHVRGVPPYLYVRRMNTLNLEMSGLLSVVPGEVPSLIIKQASSPESLFRGALSINGALVSDVIQVWLDVSAHPSRGDEQARHLEAGVLSRLLESKR